MKDVSRPILIVGSSDTSPDLEYATGFRAVDPVVALCDGRRRALVVPEMELGRARASGAALGVEVFSPSTLKLGPKQKRRLSAWAYALLRRWNVRRVTVPGFFPYGVARILERKGVQLMPATGDLFPGRAIKSAAEVRSITRAQQAAVIAMRAAIDLIARSTIDRHGHLAAGGRRLTSEAVRERILHVLLDHGCTAREVIVAGGRQAADPHCPGTGPLRAHETIVIDIFPQHTESGYWGDLTRTVVKGRATPTQRKMYHAVRLAQQRALQAIRPGISLRKPHRVAVDTFRRLGMETTWDGPQPRGFIHGTGHGVGLAVHEAPSLGAAAGRLRAGHIVTVEPGWYDGATGGVRIEDTVLVTPHGWRYLVPCEKRFEV